MAFGLIFGFSEHLFDTLLLLFVFIPLALLWVLTIVSVVLRQDLTIPWKVIWVAAVVLFPLVGILIYWIRRPSPAATDQPTAAATNTLADAVDSVTIMLEDFATTMKLAQISLSQGSEMLRDVSDLLEKTGDTIGFTVPLTNIRPLSAPYSDVQRFTRRSRALAATLGRTATAIGTNTADLHLAASRIDAVARFVRRGTARIPLPAIAGVIGGQHVESTATAVPPDHSPDS
jgi:hypothetical protein